MSRPRRAAAGEPDLVNAARALGLPRVVSFASTAASFLASAARQTALHASALAYVLFQRGKEDAWERSAERSFSGVFRPRRGGRENDSNDKAEEKQDEPLELVFGPDRAGSWEDAAAADNPEAYLERPAAGAPVQFRASIRSRAEDGDKADFRLLLFLHHFFSAAGLEEWASRVCEAVEPPEAALLGAVAAQFPAVTGVARRVLLTDAAVVFGRPLLEDCTRVELEVPLARARIREHYPGMLPVLDRIGRLEVTLLSDDGKRAACRWELRGREGLFTFCCYKRGRRVVWARPEAMPPGRGGADGPVRGNGGGFQYLDFDLGRECRVNGPLRADVRLAASFCGADFRLPQVRVRLDAGGPGELTATVTEIERTWATTTATFLLGIRSVFDDLVDSVRVTLALVADGSLAVRAAATVPRSGVLSAWVRRRVPQYVERWMAWVALFRDLCDALARDAAFHADEDEVAEEI